MKFIYKYLLVLILSFFSFQTNAAWIQDVFQDSNPKTPYCQNDDCSLDQWISVMKAWVNDIEKDRKASSYVQDLIKYTLWFVTLIAVVYIIYSGFQIMISAWSDEKVKKSKSTIFYVIMWIALMWLAYPIVSFILKILNTWNTN